MLELPAHGLATALAAPVPLGPEAGAARALKFPDVATAPWALVPSPGCGPDSPKTDGHTGLRAARLAVRVIAAEWRAGLPTAAVAYETHGGATFRGFLLPEAGGLAHGWPTGAFGVLRMSKLKPGVGGAPRVVQEAGFFSCGLLHGVYGLRSYPSKSGEERSKYGGWKMGGYAPSFGKRLHYMRERTFAAKPRDALTKSLGSMARR